MIIIRLNQCVKLCTDIYRYIRTFVYMHRARGDIPGKDSTYVTCIYVRASIIIHTRYTHREGKSRSPLLVVPTAGASCWTTHRSTDGRTIVLSQEEAGPALSTSLALDSYRRCFLCDLYHLSYLFFLLSRPLLPFDVLFLRRVAPYCSY